MKKRLLFVLRFLVGIGILFVLFKLVPYSKLLEIYKESDKIYIFLGLLGFVISHFIGLLRWRSILFSLGLRPSFKEVFYPQISSFFFNLFFPSFIGGDAFRSLALHKYKLTKIIPSVFMDRFSGMASLVILVCFSSVLGGELIREKEVFISVLMLVGCTGLVFLIVFSKSFFSFLIKILKEGFLKSKITELHNELYLFRTNPKSFIKALAYALPIQILTCVIFFIVSKAFYLDVDIIYFFILTPIIMTIAALPITIAGTGTRELAAVYFLSKVGVDKSVGLSISILNLAFVIFLGLAGGIFYVMVYHRWLESNK